MAWLTVRQPLPPQRRRLLAVGSFVLPVLVWAALSYLPFLWHPYVRITAPHALTDFEVGALVEREVFEEAAAQARAEGKRPAEGTSRRNCRKTCGSARRKR